MASNLLSCFVLISTWLVPTSSKTFCPRIFFQNINEKTMPFKMIEGVYIKQNVSSHFFPVYLREGDRNFGLYLESDGQGQSFLEFGNIFDDGSSSNYGVAAILNPSIIRDPSSWLQGSVNKRDMFKGIVQYWQYYIRLHTDDQNSVHKYIVPSSPMIKAVCVDEDFRECNSDRVYLNERIDSIYGKYDPTTDYFYREEGILKFQHLRPVYRHSNDNWYLQYVDSHWMITHDYLPCRTTDILRVKDFALRPEYITKTWSQLTSVGWRDMPNLRVLCRGVTSMSNICPSHPCYNNATCVYTSGNETLCLCTSGFTGTNCSVNKQCPTPHPEASTELALKYLEKRPGNLAVSFCRGSIRPRFYLCVDHGYRWWKPDGRDNPFWSGQGLSCNASSTPSTITTYTPPTTSYTPPSPSIIWPILFMPIVLPLLMTVARRLTRKKKTTTGEWNKLIPTDLPSTNSSTDERSYKEPLDVLVAQAILMPVFKKPSRISPLMLLEDSPSYHETDTQVSINNNYNNNDDDNDDDDDDDNKWLRGISKKKLSSYFIIYFLLFYG
ncbi:hypothetical protein ACROYT_G027216 [Oculina patagonica]